MGFIKDKKGQWAHPGKNTLIPDANGRITMKGVNQPVLGIDDEGNQEVMLPGGEYQFPGNDVYEIPLPEFQNKGEVIKGTGKVVLSGGYKDLFNVTLPTVFNQAITQPFNANNKGFDFKDYEKYRHLNLDQWQNYVADQVQLGDFSNSTNKYSIGFLDGNKKIFNQLDKDGNITLGNLTNVSNTIQSPLIREMMNQTINEFSYSGTYSDGTPAPVGKVNFDLFKQSVNSKIATFEHSRTDELATEGLDRLGYKQPNELSGTLAPTEEEYAQQVKDASVITDNSTVLFSSPRLGKNIATGKDKFDLAAGGHFSKPDLYGHMRYYRHVLQPQIMHILELQSDEMQRYHKIGKQINSLTLANQHYNRLLNGEDEQVAMDMFNRMWTSGKSPNGALGFVGGSPSNLLDMSSITRNSQFPLVTNIPKDYPWEGIDYWDKPYSEVMGYEHWKETKFPVNKSDDMMTFNSYDEILKFRDDFINNQMLHNQTMTSKPKGQNEGKGTIAEHEIANNTAQFNYLNSNYLTSSQFKGDGAPDADQLLMNLQKKSLQKNQIERLWNESVIFAVNNGFKEIAFPMSETVAKIQGYPGPAKHELLEQPWTQSTEEDFYKFMYRLTSGTGYDSPTDAHGFSNDLADGWRSLPRTYGDFVFIPEGYVPHTKDMLVDTKALTNRYELNDPSASRAGDFQTRNTTLAIPSNTKQGLYHIGADGSWNKLQHGKDEFLTVGGGGVSMKNPDWTGKEWEHSFRDIIIDLNDYRTKPEQRHPDGQQFEISSKGPGYGKSAYDLIRPLREEKHIKLLDDGEFNISHFPKIYQTILKKYTEKEFVKLITKSFGKDHPYRIGTDPQGNKFFYVKPPENWYKGEIPIQIKAKGGEVLPKYQTKGETTEPVVNYDDVEKGIRHIESLDGVLMKNEESSASGLYGQLFDEINYDGTRDEFIADLDFQKELFKKRYNGQIEGVPGLEINGIELYNEYKDQIENFNLTPTEIAALSNMLGRQGTRNYLGHVLRDGMTLEEGVPSAYGPDKPTNKTPDEFFQLFNDSLEKKQVGGEMRNEVIADMLEKGAFLPKFKMGAEMGLDGAIGKYVIKKNYDEEHRLPYIQFNSSDGKVRDNRIYYDKDDEDGTDNFSIIDIESLMIHQDREHERVKQMIRKHDNKEGLSYTEKKYLMSLGLIDDNIPSDEDQQFFTPAPDKVINPISFNQIDIEDINIKKDLYNKTDGNDKGISLVRQIELYDAHINDIYRGDNKSLKVRKIYDKLNSLYYTAAKAASMTVFDYIKSLNN